MHVIDIQMQKKYYISNLFSVDLKTKEDQLSFILFDTLASKQFTLNNKLDEKKLWKFFCL